MDSLAASATDATDAFPMEADGIFDARAGSLQVRLADSNQEFEAAQALRYRVFYDERQAVPTEEMAAVKRDFDAFDACCDHLLVIDHNRGGLPDAVVGTYRVMRRAGAAQCGQFYTASEYDISPLLDNHGEVLELGRSCVDVDYRNRATTNLLWKGISQYVQHYGIELMFGCASMLGTDPTTMALPLSYLYHNHLAPPELRVRALPALYVDMNTLPAEAIDARQALAALPPLLKGYLRLGGFVGDGAVVDPQFNTTDVCVIVKTDLVTGKYYRHYTR